MPDARVRGRYARNGPIVREAMLRADHGYVFDNSQDGAPPRLLLTFAKGAVVRATPPLPAWADDLYRRDFAR